MIGCMYVFVFDLEMYLCMYVLASKAEQLHAAADTFLNELKTSLEKSEELNKKVVYSFMYMYVHMNAGTYVHDISLTQVCTELWYEWYISLCMKWFNICMHVCILGHEWVLSAEA